MYQELDVSDFRVTPPSLLNTLTEVPRAFLEASSLYAWLPGLAMQKRGDKHPLLLIPGFLAGDASLGVLKRYLRFMGYRPKTWGIGRNTGNPDHLFDHLPEKLEEMVRKKGEPVSLIGQSLGGVYARELARQYPELVRQVITLGSPLAVKNSSATLSGLTHLFRISSGKSIDEMVALMTEQDQSPQVPVTAIYSKGDGVVAWEVCREPTEDETTQNIEVSGSHCGMAFNPAIYHIIADRLAQDVGSWKKYAV